MMHSSFPSRRTFALGGEARLIYDGLPPVPSDVPDIPEKNRPPAGEERPENWRQLLDRCNAEGVGAIGALLMMLIADKELTPGEVETMGKSINELLQASNLPELPRERFTVLELFRLGRAMGWIAAPSAPQPAPTPQPAPASTVMPAVPPVAPRPVVPAYIPSYAPPVIVRPPEARELNPVAPAGFPVELVPYLPADPRYVSRADRSGMKGPQWAWKRMQTGQEMKDDRQKFVIGRVSKLPL